MTDPVDSRIPALEAQLAAAERVVEAARQLYGTRGGQAGGIYWKNLGDALAAYNAAKP